MAKIKALVPNEKMAEYMRTIMTKEHINDCDVEIIQTAESVQAARKAIEEGASVIIARGLQAAMIKEYTKVPLVEMKLTAQEMGLMIQEAKKLSGQESPQIAFLGHMSMFPDASYMNEIFGVRMKIYPIEDFSMIEGLVEQAVKDGVDVVIGGERVQIAAMNYPVCRMMLDAREDSAREALHVAEKLLYTSRIEKENQAQLVTVLETVYNGVLRVDMNMVVTTVNHAAEIFLNENEKRMAGQPLEKVIPGLEIEYVKRVLSGKRDELNTTLRIGGENYMVSIAPIHVEFQIMGAIISINRLQQSASESPDKIQGNFFLGYLTDGDFHKIKTQNESMKHCIELAKIYALSQSPVLIYGETGTEKEIFAQGIHNNGLQKNSHFITVNCSGMTEEQQIFTLFGDEEHSGAFEQAAFGTLVIRDIDELCLRCQYRLLRILRYKAFMKTDIEQTPAFEVRVIATARKELSDKVREGQFRMDLYYIFNALSLRIPSLRERKEDIPELMMDYTKKFNKKYAKRISYTTGGMKAVTEATWEGNALQLERFCERLILTSPKRNVDEIVVRNLLDEMYPFFEETEGKSPKRQMGESPEAYKIRNMLLEQNGNRQKTAEALGISTATLWRKMKKYNIDEA